jgi:dTDP-4-amino-4,6-dideoxy-D-galactose acyltransferase
MGAQDCCQYLTWDSNHFGLRIGRVNDSKLTPALLAEIGAWECHHSIDCLYLLADPEALTMQLATHAGFRFVDVRSTFEIELSGVVLCDQSETVRLATLEDIQDLRRIAGESHRESRFYVDGNFPLTACHELYRIWIERSCRDRQFASAVFVAERDARLVAYITCILASRTGEIGLFGVDIKCRGQGWGRRLVHRALSWFRAQGYARVTVVTQGANVPAQRLYQKCGFLVSTVQVWYHRWSYRDTR